MNKQVVGLKIEGKNQSAIKIDPEMSLKEFRSQYLKDNPAYYFKSNYGLEIQRQSQSGIKVVQIITKRYKYFGADMINVFFDSKFQHKLDETTIIPSNISVDKIMQSQSKKEEAEHEKDKKLLQEYEKALTAKKIRLENLRSETYKTGLKFVQEIQELMKEIETQQRIFDQYFYYLLQSKDVPLQDIIRNSESLLVTFDLYGNANKMQKGIIDLTKSTYTFANQKLNSRILQKITYNSQQAQDIIKSLTQTKKYNEKAIGLESGYGPLAINATFNNYDSAFGKVTQVQGLIQRNQTITKLLYDINNCICIKYLRDNIALSSKTLENFKKILPLVSNNQLLRKGVYQFLEQIAYVEVGYYKFGGIYRLTSQFVFDMDISQVRARNFISKYTNKKIEEQVKTVKYVDLDILNTQDRQKIIGKNNQNSQNKINYYSSFCYDVYPNIKKGSLWRKVINKSNSYWKITEKDEIRYFKISSILKNEINKQMLNITDQILNQVCEVIDEIISTEHKVKEKTNTQNKKLV